MRPSHVPPRPIPPPLGYIAHVGEYHVPGLAIVLARPHRRASEARAFAQRIAREPASYLDVLKAFNVSGILDRRPSSHARGGTPFHELTSVREVVNA